MLNLYTGRSRLLAPALIRALEGRQGPQLIVVPKQLTLQTERMLLSGLKLRGSFELQVLSAERLCGRIFDAAGGPAGVKIDERGRVMLVRAAVRAASEQLTVYRGAEHRRGFPERCAVQLERIRQAGLTADALRACAAEQRGSAAMKLNDLSYILEAYESLIEGRYQDGESEFSAAAARARQADFLSDCSVWFFGFDMMPPTLHALIAAVAASCDSTSLFLPLENDENARDFDAFLPVQRALERLCAAAKQANTAVRRIDVEEDGASSSSTSPDRAGWEAFCADKPWLKSGTARGRMTVPAAKRHADLARLERELFAFPAEPSDAAARAVQLTLLRNPLEECMFAAALTRRLAIRRGWRYSDVLLLCKDIEGYSAPLRTAFAAYDIPLFLSSSRPAARHAAAECLLTALKLLEKGFAAEDMAALLRTGMTPLSEDEADRMNNYIIRRGLRGSRFLKPLRRGTEAEIAVMEPVRARLAEPLLRLRDRMRRAETLPAQLTALFSFLTDVDAYAKIGERMRRLADAGLYEAAGEEGQVWNRILGAMDQMHALMGEDRLSLAELSEMLTESLSAAVIKPLPQSDDAVYAQSTDGACTRSYKAVLILGAADRPVSDDEGLLTASQKQALCAYTRAYLGPDEGDLSRLRRFYLKSAIGMATDYVSVSCPLSGGDGAAQRPSAMLAMIEKLFPGLKTRGGVSGDESVERMLRAAPRAAVDFAARALAGEAEGVPSLKSDRAALAGLAKLAARRDGSEPSAHAQLALTRLGMALNRADSAERLSPATARALYGTLHRQSITQLELFAACPFSYFARYGLRPERIEPFELSAKDEGAFFHDAVNEFMLRSMDDLSALDAETAALRMDGVADALLDVMRDSGPLGDSAVSLAERRRLKATARTCAAALAEHMRGSRFQTAALEQNFGREDGEAALTLPGGCTLEGRIDRIDEWASDEPGAGFLRVIDYKRGGKALKLAEAYYGLRLQLPVYLAAAMRKRNERSAGVYYFTLSEGILSTQSVDAAAVEAERRKAFRMEGLLPDSLELLTAMSPNFSEVLKARVTSAGTLYKGTVAASEGDFENLTECALARADEHVAGIRRGECRAAPARIEQSDPCKYCDYRAVCLFDERLDAAKIRKFKNISAEAVLEELSLKRNAPE